MGSFGVVVVAHGLVGADLSKVPAPGIVTMALRRNGRTIAASPDALRAAFAEASGHLAVFVHGVCDDDGAWDNRNDPAGGLPWRVEQETGATSLVVRYNTGLSVARNGAELSRLLARIEQWWPTSVNRISLIGHSMGAMVIRAAVNQAIASHESWPTLVRDTFTLGVPHAGGLGHRAAYIVSRLTHAVVGVQMAPEFGYVDENSWDGQQVTRAWGDERVALRVPCHARAHFVTAIPGQLLCHPWVLQRALLAHPAVALWLVRALKVADHPRGALEVVQPV